MQHKVTQCSMNRSMRHLKAKTKDIISGADPGF